MPLSRQNLRATPVLGWVRRLGVRQFAVFAATRVAGGRWTRPAIVSGPPERILGPHVAVDALGTAVVLWERAGELWAADGRAGAGRWTPPRRLEQGYVAADVAADGAGNTIAAWSAGTTVLAVRRPDGVWRRLRAVPGGDSVEDIEVSPLGDVFVHVFGRGPTVFRRDAETGGWRRVLRAGLRSYGLQIAVNPAGDALLAWGAGVGRAALFEAPAPPAIRSFTPRVAAGRAVLDLELTAAGRVLVTVRRAGAAHSREAFVVRAPAGRSTVPVPAPVAPFLRRGRFTLTADTGDRTAEPVARALRIP